jgi:putative ABC transport system substrate-binding protein
VNNRRKLFIALGASALATPFGTLGQQQGKIWRVGFLTGRKGRPDPTYDTVVQALRELGYVEGKNLLMEYRAVGDMPERTASIVAELVQLNVDVIVSPSFVPILAAKQATKTIPIVVVINGDPVAAGFADSLAHPGGNITGVTRLTRELSGKRLALLKEIAPGVARVGILSHANDVGDLTKDYESGARALKLQLHALVVRDSNPDLEGAFESAAKQRLQALVLARSPILLTHARRIGELALKYRLPSMCEGGEYTDAGGLMSYSTNDTESFKRAAYYVDNIFKGAKPGDLPFEQPTRFELIVNLQTAKGLGIKIPNSILVQATKVIE